MMAVPTARDWRQMQPGDVIRVPTADADEALSRARRWARATKSQARFYQKWHGSWCFIVRVA